LAVFLPIQDIHNAVINVAISTFLAFSIEYIKLLTDFSLNHSKFKISSFFSEILNTSTKVLIIQVSKNVLICLSHKPSILNHCFHTEKDNFSIF
jgi:hypothetical protein